MTATGAIEALRYEPGVLWALDQTQLPFVEVELALQSAADVAGAIRRLSIRGAPLIGVAGGYGVALELSRNPGALQTACELLRRARPTAVNLAWAVDRVRNAAAAAATAGADAIADAALAEAQAIEAEERAASHAIALAGADLLERLGATRRILTHCNTGALAAPGTGTALGVIAALASDGRLEEVVATESRPLLQGARLTVYELRRLGIAHRLIVDSAAAGLIASGAVDAVIVGADRIAANGDVANKVGTYPLALAARAADIPFAVAAPVSTIDLGCPSGAAIEIEQRDPDEVIRAGGRPLTLEDTPCRNPAFDVTPAALVSAIITDRGVAPPESVASLTGG